MQDTKDPTVGEVRAGLARRELTQDDLADHLGVSRAYVYRRLKGEVPFTIPDLRRISTYLEVPLEALLTTPAGLPHETSQPAGAPVRESA